MTDAKKVLIIVENASPPLDIRVWYESTTLRDAGWQVSVICPTTDADQHSGIAEDLDGVKLYRFKLREANHGTRAYLQEYLGAFFQIAKLSLRLGRREQFDAVHICNPPDMFFPLMWWFRWRGARVIFDHHDLFPELIGERYSQFWGRVLRALAQVGEVLSLRSAHLVISTNESYRQVAIQRDGVPADRVVVVRNGPRHDVFFPQPPASELKAGFPYLVCFAGVMGQQDGVLHLIEAVRYIAREAGRRDIRFVLLGDGSVREQALDRIEALNLADIVHMPGMIHDRNVLRQYLAAADVCVSPEPANPLNNLSTFVKVGEYMAMGKPVVAHDLKETRATAGEAAVYVSSNSPRAFGQAILDLIDDPERRACMGALGRQRVVEELAWSCQQANLLYVYSVAMSGKRSNRVNV